MKKRRNPQNLEQLIRKLAYGDYSIFEKIRVELERQGLIPEDVQPIGHFMAGLTSEQRKGRGLVIFLDEIELQTLARSIQYRLIMLQDRILELSWGVGQTEFGRQHETPIIDFMEKRVKYQINRLYEVVTDIAAGVPSPLGMGAASEALFKLQEELDKFQTYAEQRMDDIRL